MKAALLLGGALLALALLPAVLARSAAAEAALQHVPALPTRPRDPWPALPLTANARRFFDPYATSDVATVH